MLTLDKKLKKEKINSCIVSHKGSIVYEYYRNNKIRDKVQKLNSVIIVVPNYELVTIFTSDSYSETYQPIVHSKNEILTSIG